MDLSTIQLKPSQRRWLLLYGEYGYYFSIYAFLGYIAAGIVSSFVASFLMSIAFVGNRTGSKPAILSSESFTATTNSRELQQIIKDRNIFSSTGEYPDEPDPAQISLQRGLAAFDDNAPCQKCSLPLTLMGTIYLGSGPRSLATIQENGIEQADIYRIGDNIIGNETAKIHSIEQKKVVINNNGKKECLELDTAVLKIEGADQGEAGQSLPAVGLGETADADSGDKSGCTNATIDESFVLSQAANILDKGRLIPHLKDGQHVGFKMINMDASGVFAKACIKNGDVITMVNDVPLTPERGYDFYQAFQDEKTIRVGLLRGGTSPTTVTIQIRAQ